MIKLPVIFLGLVFLVGNTSKKQVLLEVISVYSPGEYTLLNNYPSTIVDFLAKEDSVQDYIFNLPTIVHEAYHYYSGGKLNSNSKEKIYMLEDTLTIKIQYFDSFKCNELNKIVDSVEKSKLFRYNTYINSENLNLITQKNGFLGLLEEYVAYYHEFKVYISLHDFLKTKYGYHNSKIWIKYLCDIGSIRYSLDEIKLFISYYLRTAQLYYPDVYKSIIEDIDINKLYNFINSQNNILKKKYIDNRKSIFLNSKNKMILSGDFLKYGYQYKSVHDDQSNYIEKLLSNEENMVLKLITR